MLNTVKSGYYQSFGGCFIPEGLHTPISELKAAFEKIKTDAKFQQEFESLLVNYAGRETPLTEVSAFSKAVNGPRIYLKREDLLHTGAHKINNALGQCLLAKQLGKKRIIAETGAGQHGVATATACARLALDCVIYMGSVDAKRQQPNVEKIKLLGAEIRIVEQGSKTLKDAVNEALRDYAENFADSHYCIGSALGPHPYPEMVAYFQAVIGREARQQILAQTGSLPNAVIACVGGGSNAIGIFSGFIDDPSVELIGVEGGGTSKQLGQHAARMLQQKVGVLHGSKTFVLQDDAGQIASTHSISAGLDYPAIGPEHAYLSAIHRATYTNASDKEALVAFKLLCQTEGIIPALESSHALAYFLKTDVKQFDHNDVVIVNLSGRGDKDLNSLMEQDLL